MATTLPVRERGCCTTLAAPLPDAVVGELAALHKALADPARLQILHMLRAAPEPVCVCDFTAALGLSQPTVSHHLARLREAGLVGSTKRGVWSYHRLRDDMPPAARAAVAALP
jgi:ArsR family transcriptional regulator